MEDQSLDQDNIFEASTTEISHITAVLSAIAQVGTNAKLFIGSDGLIFVCENVHTIRASATFDKGLFEYYSFRPKPDGQNQDKSKNNNTAASETDVSSDDDDNNNNQANGLSQKVKQIRKHVRETIKICLDISSVVESFMIASSLSKVNKENVKNVTVRCKLCYKGPGENFEISFSDPLITEDCMFSTFVDIEEEDQRHLQLDTGALILESTLQADVIYDALNNLKDMNVQELYIYAANKMTNQKTLDDGRVEQNQLMFISKGEMGYSRFVFPELEKLVIRQYDPTEYQFRVVKNDFIVSVYKFDMFKKVMKAVKLSSKIRIRKDNKGIISVHLLTACNIDGISVNPKIFGVVPKGNNIRENPPDLGRRKPLYDGTIIEFILLELVVNDDDDDGGGGEDPFDKREIIELINNAEDGSGSHSKKRRRTRSKRLTEDYRPSGGLDVVNALKKKQQQQQQHHSVIDQGNYNDLPIIINTSRGINDILHNITVNKGDGPLAEGFLDDGTVLENDYEIDDNDNDFFF
ncbi:Rad17 protein [Saccharomycopsis crataegensis]|uniref:Rad17 protein n=1 Tax=Saccharomycopsis crataegensis TaxID=43959 RepID=A0AAV5QWX4_9ASCO|nr:Rad17 protein [Saccharomycopsis crataegensis]